MSALTTPGSIHLLIDPDHWTTEELSTALASLPRSVMTLVVGGTYVHGDRFRETMKCCLATRRPVGNIIGAGPPDSLLSPDAAFVLVPVLLGAKSTEFVTDHLLKASGTLRRMDAEVVPFGYVVLDGGRHTAMGFFTQFVPVPRRKPEIVATLALTARYLGLSGVYLEAGSGAEVAALQEEVSAAVEASGLPVIVGGGVRSLESCAELFECGAAGIVIGTAFEELKSATWLRG